MTATIISIRDMKYYNYVYKSSSLFSYLLYSYLIKKFKKTWSLK